MPKVRTPARRGPGRPPLDPDAHRARGVRYLDIAAQVFAKRGFAATDVQEVADKAGVGKATIYRHFPTKTDLFRAAIEQGVATMQAAVQAAMEAAPTPLARVRSGVTAYLSYWEEHPEMAELLVQERAEFRGAQLARCMQEREQAKEDARLLFGALIQAGQMRDVATDRFADVIFNLLYGTMYFNRMSGARKSIAAQVEDILDVFFHGSLTEAGRQQNAEATKKPKRKARTIASLLLALTTLLPGGVAAGEAVIVAAPSTTTTAPAPRLTLADCLIKARSASLTFRQARRQVAIADWKVMEAWAPSLPNISANWRNTWRNNDQGASMGSFEFITGDRETAAGQLGVTLTVMDFGKSRWYREAMRVLRDGATLDADRTGQGLDLAVTRSYVGVLAASRLITVAEQQLRLLDRQLAVSEDLLKQGQVAANDRLAVAVQHKDREQGLIKARNARATALAALNRLIGEDLDREQALDDILDQPAWAGTSAEAQRLALLYRPDLAAARAQVIAGHAGVKSAKASLLPRVYLFGNYTGTNDSQTLNHTWFDGGVGLSYSIFDGGATLAQAGRALEELAQIEDAAADRLEQIKLEVRQAWLALSSARERVTVAASALALGEDNLTQVGERYRQGLASSTDVLAEEERLAQARFNHADALYDQRRSYAELVHALGIDPLKPIVAPEQEKKP